MTSAEAGIAAHKKFRQRALAVHGALLLLLLAPVRYQFGPDSALAFGAGEFLGFLGFFLLSRALSLPWEWGMGSGVVVLAQGLKWILFFAALVVLSRLGGLDSSWLCGGLLASQPALFGALFFAREQRACNGPPSCG